jgi:DNA-binding winged helix-turn-helix (wHTH) protein/tetratricopeptide (TPR) repeat protein
MKGLDTMADLPDERTGPQTRGDTWLSFGKFEFCAETGRLKRAGHRRRLENQPARVLALLLERKGGLVTRDEIVRLLWPGEEHGDFDHRLDKIVAKLRFALGETAAKAVFVETVRGRGLRFAAEVTPAEAPTGSEDATTNLDLPMPRQGDAAIRAASHAANNKAAYVPAAAYGSQGRGRHWQQIGVVGCVLLMVAAGAVWTARRGEARRAESRSGTITVVVLGIRPAEETEAPDWLTQASTMWLSHDLQDHAQLKVLLDSRAPDTQGTPATRGAGGLPQSVLDEVRDSKGGDFAVYGTYAVESQESGPVVRLDLWMQDTRHPERVRRASVLGAQRDLPGLVRQAQEELMAGVTTPHAGRQDAGLDEAELPDDEGAERLYAEGLVAADHRDLLGASAALSKAVGLEPAHAPSHAALSAVLNELGDLAGARREYETALVHLRVMTPRQQAELWGLRCRIMGDWKTAANVYKELSAENPGQLEYPLQWAQAETAEGAASAALQTLSALPEGQRTGFESARIALMRALADARRNDYPKQVSEAAEAVADAHGNDQPLLAATALMEEGGAEFTLGRWVPAQTHWQDALHIFEMWADRRGMADVLYQQARSEWAQREPVEASRSLERSIALYQQAGNAPGLAAAYLLLARVRLYSGANPMASSAASQPLLSKAGLLYRTYGDVQGQGNAEGLAGDAFMCQSKYAEARTAYLQGLELSRASGDQSAVANRLMDLGIVASELAEDETAKQYYQQAMHAWEGLGQADRAALAQNRLANVLYREGDVDRAIALSEQSLRTLESIGYVDNGVMEDLSRFVSERDPARAEILARRSLAASTDMIDPRALPWRYMVLAEAQLAGGKVQEARESIEQAFELRPVLVHRVEASEMLWARGEVWLRLGKLKPARADFAQALAIGRGFGSKRYEMPARLGLAETDVAAHRPGARAELEQVKQDCEAMGYRLLASKAEATLQTVKPNGRA